MYRGMTIAEHRECGDAIRAVRAKLMAEQARLRAKYPKKDKVHGHMRAALQALSYVKCVLDNRVHAEHPAPGVDDNDAQLRHSKLARIYYGEVTPELDELLATQTYNPAYQ